MNTKKFSLTVKVPSSAKAKQLKSLSWQSLVFYNQVHFTTTKRKTNGSWIPFSAKTLKKKFGEHYAKHIRDLVEVGWIEVNSKYSNGPNAFTKSYRLSEFVFAQKHKERTALLGKTSWKKFTKSSPKRTNEDSPEYLRLIKERHDTLFIPHVPRSTVGRKLKTILDRKTAFMSRKLDGRVFSPIIQIDRRARKDVVFGKFGKLVNVDITAAAQQILNIGINDPKWEKWIRSGFLKCLAEAVGISPSKKSATGAFMAALSTKPKSENIRRITDYLAQEFPEIMAKVDMFNQMSSFQRETQRKEARLIAEFIQSHKHLTVLPAHDGVFCGESEALDVKDALETFLKRNHMLGLVKISPDLPHLRRKTVVELFSD